MEPYTGAQRAFCVRAYYENNKSVITARRLYRHEHGLRDLSGVPSANVIRKWIRMFETTGSTISITARGRAVSARSADIVERVRVSVQRNPQQSTQPDTNKFLAQHNFYKGKETATPAQKHPNILFLSKDPCNANNYVFQVKHLKRIFCASHDVELRHLDELETLCLIL
ncbi:hypothetical protein ACJJTC_016023 [Scirpophaga incertulas]